MLHALLLAFALTQETQPAPTPQAEQPTAQDLRTAGGVIGIALTEEEGELAEGDWRGLLHGIPWGAKDLLAVKGAPTTWGAEPYRDQVLDVDATVVELLDQAGAVLLAKLSLGALAMGDVWYGGTTKNPWK